MSAGSPCLTYSCKMKPECQSLHLEWQDHALSGELRASYSLLPQASMYILILESFHAVFDSPSVPQNRTQPLYWLPKQMDSCQAPWKVRRLYGDLEGCSGVTLTSRELPPCLPEPFFLIHRTPHLSPRQSTNDLVLEQFCAYQSPLGSQLPSPKACG